MGLKKKYTGAISSNTGKKKKADVFHGTFVNPGAAVLIRRMDGSPQKKKRKGDYAHRLAQRVAEGQQGRSSKGKDNKEREDPYAARRRSNQGQNQDNRRMR